MRVILFLMKKWKKSLVKMVSIVWDPKAREFLRKLSEDISRRIFKKINEKVENIERYLEPLVGLDVSKIRIGNYRLFVNYYKSKDLLVVHSIRHRKNAYKK